MVDEAMKIKKAKKEYVQAMLVTWEGFNILRVTLTTKYSRVRWLSYENSCSACKLVQTLVYIQNKTSYFLCIDLIAITKVAFERNNSVW